MVTGWCGEVVEGGMVDWEVQYGIPTFDFVIGRIKGAITCVPPCNPYIYIPTHSSLIGEEVTQNEWRVNKLVERCRRISGEVLPENQWRGAGESVERCQRINGESMERCCRRINGEVPENQWRGAVELVERCW